MKKIGSYLLIGGLFIILYMVTRVNIGLVNKKERFYKEFNDNGILDVRGDVNLTSISDKANELVLKIRDIFGSEEIDIDNLINNLEDIKNENSELAIEIDKLNKELNELQDTKDNLSGQYNILNKRYKEIQYEKSIIKLKQEGAYIEGVPTINQYPEYPVGCESVALTILLRYYGINVSVNDVISNLKKGSLPYWEDDNKYGGNPEVEFVGSPYNENSYGVYNHPIGEVANMYKSGANIRDNIDFDEVLSIVSSGRPVLVWTSMYLAIPYISDGWTYKLTGEWINWKANEHAVVLIGYNDDMVIISDPIGGSIKYQSRSIFESRYNYYGKKAIYYDE